MQSLLSAFKKFKKGRNCSFVKTLYREEFTQTHNFYSYLTVLPFIVISQQELQKPQCFFFNSGPKKNKMEKRVAVVQYQANSPIEDTYSCEQIEQVDGFLISVFDGHGGWQLSNYAKDNLAGVFKSNLKENMQVLKTEINEELIIKTIKDSYQSLEKNLYNLLLTPYKLGFHQLNHVGSCALSIFVHDNKLYVANLGDCKGILCTTDKSSGGMKAVKINHKLNANSPKEQARLKSKFPEDKEIFVCRKNDNSACYVKNSLQPTHTFGDFRLKYPEFNNPDNRSHEYESKRKIIDFKGPYISDEPEINIFPLTSNDRYVVMGSDGLWDELNKNEITEIVYNNSNQSNNVIAEKIFTAAFEKAAKSNRMNVQQLQKVPSGSRRKIHDDITIIVVDLKNQGK